MRPLVYCYLGKRPVRHTVAHGSRPALVQRLRFRLRLHPVGRDVIRGRLKPTLHAVGQALARQTAMAGLTDDLVTREELSDFERGILWRIRAVD